MGISDSYYTSTNKSLLCISFCVSVFQIGVVGQIASIVSTINPDELRPVELTITTSLLENQTDIAAGNATVSGTLHTDNYSLRSRKLPMRSSP